MDSVPTCLSTVCEDKDGDEVGDVAVVWRDLSAKRPREFGVQVVEVTRRVSKWDGTRHLLATALRVGLARSCRRPTAGSEEGRGGYAHLLPMGPHLIGNAWQIQAYSRPRRSGKELRRSPISPRPSDGCSSPICRLWH